MLCLPHVCVSHMNLHELETSSNSNKQQRDGAVVTLHDCGVCQVMPVSLLLACALF